MAIIANGRAIASGDLKVVSWMDDPSMRLTMSDERPRATRWIRSVVLHTTQGDEPQIIRSGAGPKGMAARTVAAWASDNRHAGAHLIVDGDGTVFCLADLVRDAGYHAGRLNEVSIGVEIAQTNHLEIFAAQLDATVLLCDVLTRTFGIQRQFQATYVGVVPRLAAGGADCIGIFGHRDATPQRGRGDPGDAVFRHLEQASYDGLRFDLGEDLAVWRVRQHLFASQTHLALTIDGIPGPSTWGAMRTAGMPAGQWVRRPGD